jgi:hypothetical protein
MLCSFSSPSGTELTFFSPSYVRLVKAYHDSAAMDAMPEQATRIPPPSLSFLRRLIPIWSVMLTSLLVRRHRARLLETGLPSRSKRLPTGRPSRVRLPVSPRFSSSIRALLILPFLFHRGEVYAFEKGSQHMCRYSTVRQLLENGDIELI